MELVLAIAIGVLVACGVWLLLTAPMSLRSLRSTRRKIEWIACSLIAPALIWLLRAHIPAAGLAVTQSAITQSIEELTPGPAVKSLSAQDLDSGVIAFVAMGA